MTATTTTAICDHCGDSIKVDILIDNNIYWCSACLLNGGRELLHQYGLQLSTNDDYYAQLGYTFWCNDITAVNSVCQKLKRIPKKEVASPNANGDILPQASSAPMVIPLVETVVCSLHYYGLGRCSCSSMKRNMGI